MNMPSTCAACEFVNTQLGSRTPCPWHAGRGVSLESRAEHPHLSVFADPRLTVDRPWPFTPREYARLLLLRGRVQDGTDTGQVGLTTADTSLVEPIAAGEPEYTAPGLIPDVSPESFRRTPSASREWLRPYLALITGLRGEPVEILLNDRTADAESDAARAWRIDRVRAQVRLLETLHTRGLLRTLSDRSLDLPEQ